MAYVAISQGLREDVRRNISSMRQRELNTIPSSAESLIVRMHQYTDDHHKAVWGEHEPLRHVIPNDWKTRASTVRFKATRTVTIEDGSHVELDASLTWELPDYIPAPPRYESHRYISVSEDQHNMKERLDNAARRNEVERRWAKVKDNVLTFLQNAKSLNEALKLWPDVRLYIPKEYLERVESKVQRNVSSRASEILKQIDTDVAVASVVGLTFAEATARQENS